MSRIHHRRRRPPPPPQWLGIGPLKKGLLYAELRARTDDERAQAARKSREDLERLLEAQAQGHEDRT